MNPMMFSCRKLVVGYTTICQHNRSRKNVPQMYPSYSTVKPSKYCVRYIFLGFGSWTICMSVLQQTGNLLQFLDAAAWNRKLKCSGKLVMKSFYDDDVAAY